MNTKKKKQPKRLAAMIFAGLCAFSVGAFAAPGNGTGGGGAGGGGAGGGGAGGGGAGGGGGGGGTPPDFGDLFVLYRDGDGIPILTADSCQQPLAAPGTNLPAVGDIPACEPASTAQSCLIPVDPVTCGVVPGYETYTQEVVFSRTNAARAPASVLQTQLDDVLINLSTADCVTRDPAGRITYSNNTNGLVTSATIDSPLQNLAIYKQLMLKGYLGAESAPLNLPGNRFDIAAVGIGAAADKGGKVTVDMVAYINQFLGLTDPAVPTFVPKKCITVKEEVMGAVQMVEKCFLNYGASVGRGGVAGIDYGYNRATNFGQLPSPAYIPAGSPQEGWSEYLAVDTAITPDLRFMITQGPTLDVVPELVAAPGLTGASLVGFAQAADDTRAIIEYLHSWPVPGTYSTPLACKDTGTISYDLSISDVSGLQVPVKMVAGTEGRELTLTVANAGPAAASGRVQLTAIDSSGSSVATFPRTFDFTLGPGTSQSWTEMFTINYPTTITWTAAFIPSTVPYDVLSTNNSVTATTQVIGSGGGSGGGGNGGGIR